MIHTRVLPHLSFTPRKEHCIVSNPFQEGFLSPYNYPGQKNPQFFERNDCPDTIELFGNGQNLTRNGKRVYWCANAWLPNVLLPAAVTNKDGKSKYEEFMTIPQNLWLTKKKAQWLHEIEERNNNNNNIVLTHEQSDQVANIAYTFWGPKTVSLWLLNGNIVNNPQAFLENGVLNTRKFKILENHFLPIDEIDVNLRKYGDGYCNRNLSLTTPVSLQCGMHKYVYKQFLFLFCL